MSLVSVDPKGVLVAGAGIGGLATALALARTGANVTVLERAAAFGEVGAGIQLGPNAVRCLSAWGLGHDLCAIAAQPQRLQVRDAHTHRPLGALRLGAHFQARYGQPYLTAHRADLHALLLDASQRAGVAVQTDIAIEKVASDAIEARAFCQKGGENRVEAAAQALIGCDGLWSAVRAQLLNDGPPSATGHLAYRALLPAADAANGVSPHEVTVWLGPQMHVVCYPVRAGGWLNLVAVVHGSAEAGASRRSWAQPADVCTLLTSLPGAHPVLQDLVGAASGWTRWTLHDRDPLTSPTACAQGRIALLGDAAHPMRPYLAQGAAMAIEDAAALAQAWGDTPGEVSLALKHYAASRWQRNARVQAKARRNGRIFHAQGVLRAARDLAMRWGGERVLDTPWLYGGG